MAKRKLKYAEGLTESVTDGIRVGMSGVATGFLMRLTGSPFLGQILGGTLVAPLYTNASDRRFIVSDSWKDAIESLIMFGR